MCERLCLSNKRANIFSREYLTNKNLSIMTDNEPEINNVCLRKEGQWKTRTNHSTSSSNSNSSNSFIYVAVEEVSAVSEWESVTKDAITESIRVNSVSQKYCSSKSKDSWYLKLKREILKSLRNKIYPVAIAGDHLRSKDSIALTCSFYRRNCQPALLIAFPHGKSIYLYVSFLLVFLRKENLTCVRLKKIKDRSAFLLARNITVHPRKKKRMK
uniref:uncharacterized protein LOC127062469 isoform X1 n=1 Tax=Vespula vulgaris TaxID=7454 RepID=UPI00212A7F90|nr:uncharacterized protein LOC127062469 isoform X1 [Vespula vulgaris]